MISLSSPSPTCIGGIINACTVSLSLLFDYAIRVVIFYMHVDRCNKK